MAKQNSTAKRSVRLKEVSSPHLEDYTLKAFDKFSDAVQRVAVAATQEFLSLAVKNENTNARLPALWGDSDGDNRKAPRDPLTVYVELAAGDHDDNPATYKFSIADLITKEDLECCADDGSFAEGLARIRDGLRKLADKIDRAITEFENGGCGVDGDTRARGSSTPRRPE